MSLPLSSSSNDQSAFPTELIRFSAKVEAARSAVTSLQQYRLYEGEYYGAQLIPLTTRDIKALDVLFDEEDIEAIDADVITALRSLWPDPCWEDDPFDVFDAQILEFLAEYL